MSKFIVDKSEKWDDFLDGVDGLKNHYVKIGVLKDDGSKPKEDAEQTTVYDVAVAHEYGTNNIPARSFIGQAIDQNKKDLFKLEEKLYNQVIDKKISSKKAYKFIGLAVKDQILEQFQVEGSPSWSDLSASTVESRQRKDPNKGDATIKILQDTGQLKNSIHEQIVKGKI